MMEEWKEYKLSDVAVLSTGFPFDGHKYSKEGIRVVRGDNVTIGSLRWDSDKDKRWSEPFERTLEYSLRAGDIVIGMDGSRVGKNRAQIKEEDLPLLIAQRVACVRNNQLSLQSFLYYQIFSDRFEQYIKAVHTGTSIPHVSLKQIGDFTVSLPPLAQQQQIASILSSLDDKIELNRRINENLEAQAQALFKSWFVDFEPFKDGEFVESELGMIPLSEICEQITDGVHNSVKDEPNSNYILLSCKNITGGVLSKNNYRSISKSTFESLRMRTKLAKGDVLLSSVGTIGEIAIVEEDPINYEFQRSVAIVKPKKNIGTYFLYNALLASKVRLQHAAHGAVQQCLFIGDLKKFKVICCDTEKVSRYNETVRPLFEEIAKLHQESTRLSTLRDTLLPRLMSGEIKVGDVTL